MSIKTDSVCGIIVAAGSGTRMGGVSKPEIKLDGKTLFQRVLEAFLASSVSELVVVGGENLPRLRLLAERYRGSIPIRFCEGGKTRTESVFKGVCQMSPGISYACVHDCARPFVTPEIIEKTVRKAETFHAAAPAVPVKDTIKTAENRIVTGTPDRSTLFAVQTPQIFDFDLLRGALQKALDEELPITDDCSAVEAMGMSVYLTEGSDLNIKVTTPTDLILAEAILRNRGEA